MPAKRSRTSTATKTRSSKPKLEIQTTSSIAAGKSTRYTELCDSDSPLTELSSDEEEKEVQVEEVEVKDEPALALLTLRASESSLSSLDPSDVEITGPTKRASPRAFVRSLPKRVRSEKAEEEMYDDRLTNEVNRLIAANPSGRALRRKASSPVAIIDAERRLSGEALESVDDGDAVEAIEGDDEEEVNPDKLTNEVARIIAANPDGRSMRRKSSSAHSVPPRPAPTRRLSSNRKPLMIAAPEIEKADGAPNIAVGIIAATDVTLSIEAKDEPRAAMLDAETLSPDEPIAKAEVDSMSTEYVDAHEKVERSEEASLPEMAPMLIEPPRREAVAVDQVGAVEETMQVDEPLAVQAQEQRTTQINNQRRDAEVRFNNRDKFTNDVARLIAETGGERRVMRKRVSSPTPSPLLAIPAAKYRRVASPLNSASLPPETPGYAPGELTIAPSGMIPFAVGKLNVAETGAGQGPKAKAKKRMNPKLTTKRRAGNAQKTVTTVDESLFALETKLPTLASSDGPAIEIDRSSWVRAETLTVMQTPEGPRAPIWTETRQELCESLDYFRAYQGGHYTHDGLNHGYLLSCFGAPRDVFADGGRVIISHGGGGSTEQTEEAGGESQETTKPNIRTYGLSKSQTRDNFRIRALTNNIKHHVPVVLLADASYPHTPFVSRLGARYAVLGHFYVTHAWAEAEETNAEKHVRLKFRFEWVASQGPPWWFDLLDSPPATLLAPTVEPQSSVLPLTLDSWRPLEEVCKMETEQAIQNEGYCASCDSTSPLVYCEGFICLNELCDMFFLIGTRSQGSFGTVFAKPVRLTYESVFLRAMFDGAPSALVPCRLLPQSIADLRTANELLRYDRACWKGWHCRACGRLSCREQWDVVECASCNDSFKPVRAIYSGTDLRPQTAAPTPQYTDGITASTRAAGLWQVTTYTMPVDDGFVHHIVPLPSIDTIAPQRVESIFAGYQTQEGGVPFRRNELKAHKLGSRMLAQSFSFNAGEPYKFSVRTWSIPFSESPQAVLDALAFLDGAVRESLPGVEPGFNECAAFCGRGCTSRVQAHRILSLAYMQGQKIAFHDDGEVGVGPIVATLSLGSDAAMSFRRKRSKKDGAQPRPTGRMGRVCLKLTLRHGDVVVMQGADVQKYFEHAVTPDGYRIGALSRSV